MRARRMGLVAVVGVVVAMVVTPGATAKPPQKPPPSTGTLQFAGRTWNVKSSSERVGPGSNYFSAANAYVDGQGLHLKITKNKRGRWDAAEVVLAQSLGYGTYRWTLATDVSNLDPNVVLGMFTWDDADTDPNHREIDIEVARWGTPPATEPTNAQYVVQPADGLDHLHRFTVPRTTSSTHSFTWGNSGAKPWATFLSQYPGGVSHGWDFPDSAPLPGGEHARMNLWLFQGSPPMNGQPVEVVFSDFEYCLPSGGACS